MRPKKRVLLVDADERRLSLCAFVLRSRGQYRVQTAASFVEALNIVEAAPAEYFHLLLTQYVLGTCCVDGNQLARGAKLTHPDLMTLLLVEPGVPLSPTLCADAVLGNGAPMSELLERVRLLTARKRGPKPVPRPEPLPGLVSARAA